MPAAFDSFTAFDFLAGVTEGGEVVEATPAEYQSAWQTLIDGGEDPASYGFQAPADYAAHYAAAHPEAAPAPAASPVLPLAAAAVAAWFLLKK